jgi:membrane protein
MRALDRVKEQPAVATALAVQARVGELGGGFMASAVTLSLFLSLFPLLLVGMAVIGFVSSGDSTFAGDVVRNLGVTGDAADSVVEALRTAERTRGTTSVIGLVTLLWSGLGVVGAIQHLCDRTWQVEDRGLKDKAYALLWLAGAVVLLGTSFFLSGLVPRLPGWAAPISIVIGVVADTAFFLWTFRILTGRALPLRTHLPGSVLGGVGFHLLTVLGAVILPGRVTSSSAVYGSLGVVVALLAWLLLFGRLLVYAATLNVVLHERHHGTVQVVVPVPRIDGDVPLAATRSGVRLDRT